MTNEERKTQIATLIRERLGYEASGNTARMDAVDAELARLGHKAQKPVERATKRSYIQPEE